MKLNEKNIRLWIKALESGEFKQTRETLRRGTEVKRYRHCCLGVTCELYSQKVGGFWDGNAFISGYDNNQNELFSSDGLSEDVETWVGFDSEYIQNIFSTANDIGKATFTQIAQVLRAALSYQRKTHQSPESEWYTQKFNDMGISTHEV